MPLKSIKSSQLLGFLASEVGIDKYDCLHARLIQDCFTVAIALCTLIEGSVLLSNRVKSDLLVMLVLLVLLAQEERLDCLVLVVLLALQ